MPSIIGKTENKGDLTANLRVFAAIPISEADAMREIVLL